MTRRDLGFLLIGLGAGLLLAVAGMVISFAVWSHHMFIMGFSWRPSSALLLLPFLLGLSGFLLLRAKATQALR